MRNNKGIIHLLPLLLVGLLIVGVIAGMYYLESKNGNPIIHKSSPTPESAMMEDEYINKKTEYKYNLLPGWEVFEKEPKPYSYDWLILEKDDHYLKSYLTAAGGGVCIYPDTENIPVQYEGQEVIENYVQIIGKVATYRRQISNMISDGSRVNFAICQKGANLFENIVLGKFFYYDVPTNYNPDLLKEMDKIMASFEFTE